MPSNYHHPFAPRFTADDILGHRYFVLMVVLAAFLHAAAVYAWYLMPKMRVVDIPVRALNIRLGDGDVLSPEALQAQPNAGNYDKVENTISRLVRDPAQEEVRTQSVARSMEKAMNFFDKTPTPNVFDKGKYKFFDRRSEGVNIAAPVAAVEVKQFVRDLSSPATPTQSDVVIQGNSKDPQAEMISRYEQTISLWIQKFKIYPEEARAGGMEGETVVRIRINRRGDVHYYALERTTGYQVLDRAALDMVRRANPVPAVPSDYPPGEVLEFLIPVSFNLQ